MLADFVRNGPLHSYLDTVWTGNDDEVFNWKGAGRFLVRSAASCRDNWEKVKKKNPLPTGRPRKIPVKPEPEKGKTVADEMKKKAFNAYREYVQKRKEEVILLLYIIL